MTAALAETPGVISPGTGGSFGARTTGDLTLAETDDARAHGLFTSLGVVDHVSTRAATRPPCG
jgi:hypothetical protein